MNLSARARIMLDLAIDIKNNKRSRKEEPSAGKEARGGAGGEAGPVDCEETGGAHAPI